MPRNISFALTTDQIRNQTKTVTRRKGWKFLKPGQTLNACVKCMGLKPGEKIERICQIRVVKVSFEYLSAMNHSAYGDHEAAREGFPELTGKHTYLFEIIYPENRIVVDHGDTEELVLLAAIETATGNEIPLADVGLLFPRAVRYDGIKDLNKLLSWEDDKTLEGFVVRFQSGQRVKIKFNEYKRLHKLLTGVSARAVWDVISSGGDVSELIEAVPDEFYAWVRETENDLRCEFAKIESTVRSQMVFSGSRRELAEKFKKSRYPSIMFSILDGKDFQSQIWRMVRPSGRVFRAESTE